MDTVKYTSLSDDIIQSLGFTIPAQLEHETEFAYKKIREVFSPPFFTLKSKFCIIVMFYIAFKVGCLLLWDTPFLFLPERI